MPIPLGGTSNHFRTDVLRELHAWDPFNVTEDADLGIRMAQKGYRVGVVDSTTFEEASCRAGQWIRQRSRWIKGYMQTFLVHTRRPLHLSAATGRSVSSASSSSSAARCCRACSIRSSGCSIWSGSPPATRISI